MAIDNVTGVRSEISEMLSKIREVSNKTKVFSDNHTISPSSKVTPSSSFENVLSVTKGMLGQVNQLQTASEQVKNAFIAGDSTVSMSQVLIASQKSKLAFEGLVTVRNKILEAYKEIMNMPI